MLFLDKLVYLSIKSTKNKVDEGEINFVIYFITFIKFINTNETSIESVLK